MSLTNAANSNSYITDIGVSLVFGLGYYMIKYFHGENDSNSNKNGKIQNHISYENCKTIEEFNQSIKTNEDEKMNPFEVLALINKCALSPDTTTYNNLLNFCYKNKNFEAAEKLVEEIFAFGNPVQVDLSTFNILLKGLSCKLDTIDPENSESKKEITNLMEKILKDIEKSNLKANDVTINTCLDILIKAGEIENAYKLFDNMTSIYGVTPDKYSYSTIIKALKFQPDEEKLERAFGILEYLKQKSGSSNSNDEIIFNCLLDVCIKLNLIKRAEQVFSQMKDLGVQPSKITYAIMIKGYGQVYDLNKALSTFHDMKIVGVEPNEIVFGCLLNACVRCSNLEKITEVYEEIKEKNIEMNIVLYTTLIKAYTKVKNLEKAFDVYKTMLSDTKISPNIVIHNAMLDCCVECNDINKLKTIYEQIKQKAIEDDSACQPDLITYSTVIKGYARAKDMEKVFDIYNFLISSNFKLDEVAYNSILDGCAKTNNIQKALLIFEDMNTNNVKMSNVTYSIMVKVYANNGEELKALQVLETMRTNGIKPGIIVYTCLIQTCLKSKNKKFNEAINLFEQLKSDKLFPDHVLYNTIVNGCLYNSKWEMACKYTLEAFNIYNIKMASDIYRNVLEKLTMHYCTMDKNLKSDNIAQILKCLKERNIFIEEATYQKAMKLVIKTHNNKSNNYNKNTSNNNTKQYTSKNNFEIETVSGDKHFQSSTTNNNNKDQLKWQRKNNF